MSTKFGVAPQYFIGLTVPTNETDGVITSCLSFIFRAFKHKCRADVPELTAIAYFDFVNIFISFSKIFISLPYEET